MKSKSQIIVKFVAVAMLVATLTPGLASATGEVTSRSSTVSSSAGGATGVTYTESFTLGTSGQTLGAIKFEICDSPASDLSCSGNGNSSGASFGAATFGSVSGLSGSWSANAGTAAGSSGTSIVVHKAVAGVESGTPTATIVLDNVTNPTANNVEYYLRISTYSDTGATTPIYPGTDFGGVALATTSAVTVSGTMPESLVFCIAQTITGNCATATGGSAVDLGVFSPSSTNVGSIEMDASTNAGSGYVITVNGSIPTSGANNIQAMGTQSANSSGCATTCTSTFGVSQFGTNVRGNATPVIGSDVTPTSAGYNGVGIGGYDSPNSFRFFSGDTVASSTTVSNAQLYTNSYIVNVPGNQPAGLYSTTLTYICTATF